MSRPKKDGLDYFPVDTVFDEKIDAIESIHKNDGIVWCLRFWQKAYKTMTGIVDFNGLFAELFANKCRITIEDHRNILKTAVTVDFCHEVEPNIFTSNGIQKRISSVSKERSEAIERQNKKGNKKKVKKSKVKGCPDYSANNSEQLPNNEKPFIPDHLKEVFPMFEEMRKKLKKPLTENAKKLIIEKLNKLSTDKNEQIEILKNSIVRSWQGVYPLKNNGQQQSQQLPPTSAKYRPMPRYDNAD